MNPHHRTLLYSALLGIGTALAAGATLGVNLSTDGRGQVLLYPYYTTRADAGGNTFATLLSVINSTPLGKAVRVRFLEGKDGREVFNANLFLSPYDVWTAAVLPDSATALAKIGTIDLSCTLPAFSASPTAPFIAFSNASYSGANDDGAGTTLDRAKEGYFEVIEMATYASNSTTGIAITHVNGVPPCGAKLNDAQAAADAQPPTGGLFGGLTLINVNAGTDYTADATALASFYQGANYQSVSSILPNLTQATPPISSVATQDGHFYESTWAPGTADAVSAVLMHDSVMNEFVLDSATKSGTDWVITMPTKRYYVPTGTGNAPKLFQRNFNGSAGSCDDVIAAFSCNFPPGAPYGIYDREEQTVPGTSFCFSAAPQASIGPPALGCWASNVMTFNGAGLNAGSIVLGSTNDLNLATFFQNGWVNFQLAVNISGASPAVHMLINSGATSISGGGKPTTTGNAVTYTGLPMIGFAVISFTNGTLQVGSPPVNVLSNYGGNFAHKFSTTIQ